MWGGGRKSDMHPFLSLWSKSQGYRSLGNTHGKPSLVLLPFFDEILAQGGAEVTER